MKTETILKQIAEKNGGLLRPADVVSEAANPKHPLHTKFTWDDTEAAKEYRLWQARKLIMSVRVTFEPRDREPMNIRAFVSLTTDRRGEDENAIGYREVLKVARSQDLRAQMLSDALAELQSFQNKYNQLEELACVFDAIRKVKK